MDYDCAPASAHGGGMQSIISDNILLIIIVLAILYGLGYFIIKAGVKNGILEALKDPACPITPPCDPCGL